MSKIDLKNKLLTLKQSLIGFEKTNRIPTNFVNSNLDHKTDDKFLDYVLFYLNRGSIANPIICKENVKDSDGAILFEQNIDSEKKIRVL